MYPIFETCYAPGTTSIRVGDIDVDILGEVDGKVIVEAPEALALEQEWTRRPDLMTQRREYLERQGEQLAAEMAAADAAYAAQEQAETERQALLAKAADEEAQRTAADEAARVAAAQATTAPTAADPAPAAEPAKSGKRK